MTREGRFAEMQNFRRGLVTDEVCSDSESWERAKLEFPPLEDASSVKANGVWEALAVSASVRESDPRTEVEWVSRHILIPPESIKPDSVPSSSAVALLVWARQEKSEFYRGVYAKIMPKQSEVDREARFKDDGRKVTDIIDQVRRSHPLLSDVRAGSKGDS